MGFAKVYIMLDLIFVLLTAVRGYQGFEYGAEAADSLLSASGDKSSVEVVSFTPFVFYGSSKTSIFVSIQSYDNLVQKIMSVTTLKCG